MKAEQLQAHYWPEGDNPPSAAAENDDKVPAAQPGAFFDAERVVARLAPSC